MKIFISGVAGFLGSHLADSLIAEGHEVIGADNLIGGDIKNVPEGVDFYEADVCEKSVQSLLKDVDVVYHCAAHAQEGLSFFSPNLITESCFNSTVNLMTGAVKHKVKRFILMSSIARYGSQAVPFTEDMQPMPCDPYGVSKVAAEGVVRTLGDTHGVEWVIAVPHNIIGPRQKYDDPYRNVVSIMMNLLANGKAPIIYGDGEQKRCFSFVQDDVDILKKMATDDSVVGQIINVGPDEEFVTINELADKIIEIMGSDLKPVYVEGRPGEVKLATASADKARALLGYKTKYSLKEGLKTMFEEIKKNPKPFNYHLEIEILNEKTPKTWSKRMF